MLLSDNVGDIRLTKKDIEQVAIEKLNPRQYKNVVGFWKNTLLYMTNWTTDLQNKIQEWKNLLKSGYLPRNNMWTAFCQNLGYSINYMLMVTTLSNIEASTLTVYLYR